MVSNKLSTVKDLMNILMADCVGGDINSDANESLGGNHMIVHCWDGRRYLLSLEKLPNGCAYDAKTGDPIK